MSELNDNECEASPDMEPAAGYKVGFGKPPVEHRFKPGKSGNPRGREKAYGSMTLSLVRGFKQPIRITKGTVEKNVPKEEVALQTLINKSLRGDWRAFMALMKKGVKLGLIKPVPVPTRGGGVIKLPMEYWYEKKAERAEAIRKEIERRNALFNE
jgi:hypothetical protein